MDILAGSDEFAAALESPVAHFELYDDVRFLVIVIIGDEEESISEPQERCVRLQFDAREFLQLIAAQSMHAERLVRIWVGHRHERVAAARRGEEEYFLGTWMRWTRAMRAPLSTLNSSIYVVLY